MSEFLVRLRDDLVTAFGSPSDMQDWVNVHVPGENFYNIVNTTSRFDAQITQLLDWADSQGRSTELLQALADHPPGDAVGVPQLINVMTRGEVRPTTWRNGFVPVAPVLDWFVTQRPFANRKQLRNALETFDAAADGADSVLIIDGKHGSGKSYGIRFAVQCAPRDRFVPVDVAFWNDELMTARDLASAIYPGDEAPAVDLTKEDAAIPKLVTWLRDKLKGTKTWIIIDHCNRENLTGPAQTLITKLAEAIEMGWLPGIRLIVADADHLKLPAPLAFHSRRDHADLPNRQDVEEWCRTLVQHIGKTCTDEQIQAYLDDVFKDLEAINSPSVGLELETRLTNVYNRIKA